MENTRTVLVIDDSPTEAKIVTRILEGAGFTVRWANNAIDGVELAKEILPSLILMDVVMPGMNGFQATRAISRQAETQEIPIIMLTTKDQLSDRAWAQRQGASDYLTKPTDAKLLLETIQTLIG